MQPKTYELQELNIIPTVGAKTLPLHGSDCVDSIDEGMSMATDIKSHKNAIKDFTAQLRNAS